MSKAAHQFSKTSRAIDAPRLIGWVSAATLAELLDTTDSTIWEWTRKGILPKPVRISGGATRWKWSEVESRLDPGSAEPEDPILKASRGR